MFAFEFPLESWACRIVDSCELSRLQLLTKGLYLPVGCGHRFLHVAERENRHSNHEGWRQNEERDP